MKDYLMKVTTNSPRRSQYNGLLISPATGTAVAASAVTAVASNSLPVKGSLSKSISAHHHLTPTYVKGTGASFSSLKRAKNSPYYGTTLVKSSPCSTMDNRSIYTTLGRSAAPTSLAATAPASQYRSPSRILLESGYLTLPHLNSTQAPHHHQGKDHVYENLYSSPNNTNSALVDVTDTGASSPACNTKGKYMNNLRSSVQLKRSASHSTSIPPPASLPLSCTNCSKGEVSPSVTTTSSSLDRKLYKYKLKDRKETKCHLCSNNDNQIIHNQKLNDDKSKSSQLNQQVIWIKDNSAASSSKQSPLSSKHCNQECKRRKKKKSLFYFFSNESFDQQKRFQFIQSTLIICNVFALLLGITGLIVAGFVDARPSLTSFGGQLMAVSVYIILTSLTGLYGARRESISLLLVYGIMIVLSLFLRSIFYFIISFVSSDTTSIAASMIAAFLEVLLIFFAFALASEVRLKKLDRQLRQSNSKSNADKSTSGTTEAANDASSKSEKVTDVERDKIDADANKSAKDASRDKHKNNLSKYITNERDIESSSPVASAETDSTTSHIESSLFNGKDELANLFTLTSPSPLFSFSSPTPSNSNSSKVSPMMSRQSVSGSGKRHADQLGKVPLTPVSPGNRFNSSSRPLVFTSYNYTLNTGLNSRRISSPSSSQSPTSVMNNRPAAYF